MPDPVGRVRSELDRARRILGNATDRAVGGDRVEVGQTPRTRAWRDGRASLWRYDAPEATAATPVLIVHSLVSRAFILDLQPGNSVIEGMLEAGLAPWLLEFGEPDARDAGNTLATYTDAYLPAAAAEVRAQSGTDDLLGLGYCFGGDLLTLSAADPDGALGLRGMAIMATPLDFHEIGLLVDLFLDDRVDLEDQLDASGNLPVDAVERGFKVLQPTNELASWVEWSSHLDDDRWLDGAAAMRRWLDEQVPFPGATFIQSIEQLARPNALLHGGLDLDGRRRDLTTIDCPVLVVAAEQDHIVPMASAVPDGIEDRFSGDVDVLTLDAGHVGMVAGRAAATETVPKILEWLVEHSG